MSPLLRSPHTVPSLFSQGLDLEEPGRPAPKLAVRVAKHWSDCRSLWNDDAETAAGRRHRAMAGTTVVLLAMGKPLYQALVLVSIALVR